jgi:hypothetical protein
MTILDIAKTLSRRLKITVPTAFVASTSNNQILLKEMIYETIQALRDAYEWPELTRQYSFRTIDGLANYPLPLDYDRRINQTLWNRDQNWPLLGPVTPQLWQQLKSGLITSLPMQRHRVKGIEQNQFFIDPTPTGTDGDQEMVYEYITQTSIRPVAWAANTAYTTSSFVFFNGLILKGSVNGTSNATAGLPPVYGVDNTVLWDAIPDYVASQVYYYGQYVYANSKVYKVTTAGLSSAGSPSVTSGSETLGTVVFEYQSTPSAWAGGTEYSHGDYAVANSHALYCNHDGVSGRLAPKFYAVYGAVTTQTGQLAPPVITKKIADGAGALVWDVYELPFTQFQADTDEVLLDNELIIDGAEWRFLKNQRQAYDDFQRAAENKLDIAKTKKQGASVVSMNGRSQYPFAISIYNYADGNYGIDS